MRIPGAVVSTGLAVVAGSVDAIGLTGTGRFTSHMTGAATHTAMRLADGQMGLATLGALAVASFILGSGTTGVVIAATGMRGHARTIALLISAETLAIASAGLTMVALARGTWAGMSTIALLAFAMGLQNATTTYLLKSYERTTHVTSNITDLGVEVGMRLRLLARSPPRAGACCTGRHDDDQRLRGHLRLRGRRLGRSRPFDGVRLSERAVRRRVAGRDRDRRRYEPRHLLKRPRSRRGAAPRSA